MDIEAGIRAVRTFIQVHGARFGQVGAESKSPRSDPDRRDRILNQAGRKDEGEGVYHVIPDVFENEILAAYNHRVIVKELIDRGCLIPGGGKNLKRKKRVPGATVTPRFYAVSQSILVYGDSGEGEEHNG
jgi:hypothetical protein